MIARALTAVVFSILVGVASADAQCAMCVTALEQNGGELAAGFNRGILFLLGMPYLVFGAIGAGHYLRKKRRSEDRDLAPASNPRSDSEWRAVKRTLASFWWLLTGYTVLVILWGAFVRASGSGAGCGSHWPLCNGVVLPRSPGLETLIELTHRITSGALGLCVVALAIASFRHRPRGHVVRKGAVVVLAFVVIESLVGAGLVKFEWVAANASMERVYVMAFHLVNTMLLVAALVVTAWFAGGERRIRVPARRAVGIPFSLATFGLLLTGMSGAVTALGDTLVLSQGLRADESPVVAGLVASRAYHPSVAVVVFGLVLYALWRVSSLGDGVGVYGRALTVAFGTQLALGLVNVWLRAPTWMQLVHLAMSNVVWVLFLLVVLEALFGASPGQEKSPSS